MRNKLRCCSLLPSVSFSFVFSLEDYELFLFLFFRIYYFSDECSGDQCGERYGNEVMMSGCYFFDMAGHFLALGSLPVGFSGCCNSYKIIL